MLAADTSSLIAFLSDPLGPDVVLVRQALEQGTLVFPPVVLTECLSGLKGAIPPDRQILACPLLEISAGYWVRAAATRAAVLAHGLRATLGDALIAQSCIDHDVALITRDTDFRHFAKYCGLRLA